MRQGQGKPNRIYILSNKHKKILKSKTEDNLVLEQKNFLPNNTNLKKTEINNIKDLCYSKQDLNATLLLDYEQHIDIFIELPLNDGTTYIITNENISQWAELYPKVDTKQQLRNLKGWLLANPKKRKTKSGILRFVTNWLCNEQNKSSYTKHEIGNNVNLDFFEE